jgi:hypothetical protein
VTSAHLLTQPSRVVAPLLWSVYLLSPARGWGWLDGVPLGAVSTLALCGVWWLWSVGRRLPGWRVAAIFLLLRAGGAAMLCERGLTASYFANDSANAPAERSVEYRHRPYTRVDPGILFGPAEARDLPLFFFNDYTRFNFYRPDEPSRNDLPYSVDWTGNLLVDADETMSSFLVGERVHARIVIDTDQVLTLDPDQTISRGPVHLRRGWHHLVVALRAPYRGSRAFYAGLIDHTGIDRPFEERNVYVHRVALWRLRADRFVRRSSQLVDALMIAALALAVIGVVVGAMRQRTIESAIAILSLIAIVEAYWFAKPWLGRMMLLSGGDDMLTYETFARDILLHGPLMTVGRAVGSAEAFYYQPLYPYVLALLHAVFGDGYFGIVFVQRLLVGATVAVVWRTTHVLFGRGAGITAGCFGAWMLYTKLGPWASVLLGDIVFVPLVCAWALLTVRLAVGEPRTWGGAGIVGGLATLSRSSLLLAWAPVAAVAAVARRRAGRSLLPVVASVALMPAVVSIATLRNWIASRSFVPITTSFPTNFHLGNQPPPGVRVPDHLVTQHRLYTWFARDDRTRMAIEFARHAPRAFARNLLDKALYTMGFFGAYVAGGGWSPLLVFVWVTAIAGGSVMRLRSPATPEPGWPGAIPGVIAVSHFIAVTIIFPNVYGDRLILPFYALILPYSALALWVVLRSCIRRPWKTA